MNDVTAIIISFLRPAYTKACIESLTEMYPGIKIIVGENGTYNEDLAKLIESRHGKYIQLPYDSGVCVGRNTLAKEVETPFILVGDDDFFYDHNAKVLEMTRFMRAHPEVDLIGGRVSENGMVRNYQGTIDIYPRHIVNRPLDVQNALYMTDEHSGLRYVRVDMTFNFFVAKTSIVQETPWDEEIKVAYEHESWFIDLKQKQACVVFSPDPVVIHKPEHVRVEVENSDDHMTYKAFRNRRTDKERFFKRHKLRYVIDMNGNRDDAPNSPIEKKRNDTKYVDFCITTFMRPKALEKLLFSIAEYYPMANVYVADQNEMLDREFYKDLRSRLFDAGLVKRVSIEHLPYDCGVSYARNHLVTSTPNKYKLILDDDMAFTEETDIGKMVRIMESDPNIGIVGAVVKQNGIEMHYEFTPEKRGDTMYHVADKTNWKKLEDGTRYRKVGCVLNFALFKSDVFRDNLWDEKLKVTEHLDFYIRFNKISRFSVAYTPDTWIDHPPAEKGPDYKEFRQRPEFLIYMYKKHGITRVKYLNGHVTEVNPDGSITRYNEKPEN